MVHEGVDIVLSTSIERDNTSEPIDATGRMVAPSGYRGEVLIANESSPTGTTEVARRQGDSKTDFSSFLQQYTAAVLHPRLAGLHG